MAERTYFLAPSTYEGSVAGDYLSYNNATRESVENLENPELKKFREDAAISAALSRGYNRVVIRFIPHASTLTVRGRIPTNLHITISVGNAGLAAHIPCEGLDISAPNWYTSATHGEPKWGDRATSLNASDASGQSPSARSASPDCLEPGASSSAAGHGPLGQWVLTSSNVLGQQYVWWDGTRFINEYI